MSEEKKDTSFSDSELEDIMNEIESLENDFPDEESSKELSKLIDEAEQEVQKTMEAQEPVIEEPIAEAVEEPVAESIDDEMAAMMEEPVSSPVEADIMPVDSEMDEKLSELSDALTGPEDVSPEDLVVSQDEIGTTALQDSIDAEMDDIIAQAQEEVLEVEKQMVMPEDNVFEMSAPEEPKAPANVFEMPVAPTLEAGSGAETSMSFSMAGNAKIHLNFEFNGQKVALHVDEKDGFVIEMNNGMKFSIPVEEKKAS